MRKLLAALVVLIVIVVAVLLIGGHKNNNSSSTMGNMPMPAQHQQTSSQAQATDKVTIANFAFSPASITVKKGTTVTWTNQDSVAHTVTETDGQNGPQSQALQQGQSYTFTYNTVGTFKYHCSIHPNMTGAVTVTE